MLQQVLWVAQGLLPRFPCFMPPTAAGTACNPSDVCRLSQNIASKS